MERRSFSKAYRGYVLGILTLVFTMNYIDRGLLALLLQTIKADLRLSDTQLGFLTGIAFGLFYATLGLPIARWADRGNRITLTSIAIGLWGATVMACVLVTSFAQLVAARIAAAVGESGCMPPTYSLLGDFFPEPAQRARAMAIYWLANPLAALISYMVGGWLNELYGWRMTFLVMGMPGLIIAVLVKVTMVEPRLQDALARGSQEDLPPVTDVLACLWQRQSLRHLSVAIVLLFTMALGLAPWYAAFLIRTHGLGTAELGVWLGLIFGIGGTGGTLLGGYVVGRWLADKELAQVRLMAALTAFVVPLFVAFLLLPQRWQALTALGPLIVTFTFFLGPTFALLQRVVPADMRATTLSVVMLVANLIGMGLGPQAVGILSDALRPFVGTDSLRYAMLLMSGLGLWAARHLWRAGRTIKADLALTGQGHALDPAPAQ